MQTIEEIMAELKDRVNKEAYLEGSSYSVTEQEKDILGDIKHYQDNNEAYKDIISRLVQYENGLISLRELVLHVQATEISH